MKTFVIELKKSKRTGFIPLMLAVGIMGLFVAEHALLTLRVEWN